MSETAIRISDFYFAYLNSDLVLKDINLDIQKGSFTAIAGPSGAGKTTLCKAMTGIVPPLLRRPVPWFRGSPGRKHPRPEDL